MLNTQDQAVVSRNRIIIKGGTVINNYKTPSGDAEGNSGQATGIFFNVQNPIQSFYGRKDFLVRLHEKIQENSNKSKVLILSQVKVVSGLGGIGKTETMRKYIFQFKDFYTNVIWIDAETINTMTDSFLQLATQLRIPTQHQNGKPRELKELLFDIYNKICDSQNSNLIIFDNAEDLVSESSGIQRFFPRSLPSKVKIPSS